MWKAAFRGCPDAFSPGPVKETQRDFFQTDEQGYPCDVKFFSPPLSQVTTEIGDNYTDYDSMGMLNKTAPRLLDENSTDMIPFISATDSNDGHQLTCTDQEHTYIIEDSIQYNASIRPTRPTNGGHRHREV